MQTSLDDLTTTDAEETSKKTAKILNTMRSFDSKNPFDGFSDDVEYFCSTVHRLFQSFPHAFPDVCCILQGMVINKVMLYLKSRFKYTNAKRATMVRASQSEEIRWSVRLKEKDSFTHIFDSSIDSQQIPPTHTSEYQSHRLREALIPTCRAGPILVAM